MGQIVNLRLARKRAQRRAAAEEAAENRSKHGRTKAERTLEAAQSAKTARDLDGHRLDTEDA
jgi:Domain of unknown function (DUF4169)